MNWSSKPNLYFNSKENPKIKENWNKRKRKGGQTCYWAALPPRWPAFSSARPNSRTTQSSLTRRNGAPHVSQTSHRTWVIAAAAKWAPTVSPSLAPSPLPCGTWWLAPPSPSPNRAERARLVRITKILVRFDPLSSASPPSHEYKC
jgi:hypothetical protein